MKKGIMFFTCLALSVMMGVFLISCGGGSSGPGPVSSAGITVTESGGSTDVDEGGTDTYTVVLDKVPTGDVTVTATPDANTDLGSGNGVPVALTFTTANWNVAQTVTVTGGVDAAIESPSLHTSTITHTAASAADPDYDGIAVNSVVANVTDKTRLVYAANYNNTTTPGTTISGYFVDPTSGNLSTIPGQPFSISVTTGTVSVVVEPRGKYLYVTDKNDGTAAGSVSAFAINQATGGLTELSASPFGTGQDPLSLVADPGGDFIFVCNRVDGVNPGSVSSYSINLASGNLSAVTSVSTGVGPSEVTIDPTGNFLYVSNTSDNTVSAFTISGTGTLTEIGGANPSPYAAGSGPTAGAIDPNGSYLYVANLGDGINPGTVSAYSIDAGTGALTPIQTINAGISPRSLKVDSTGSFLYVANIDSDNISAYSIDPSTGILTPNVPGSPIPTGSFPHSLNIDPTGTFLYTANLGGDNISAFSINQSTGALTATTPPAFTAGLGPASVTSMGIDFLP